MCVVKVLVKEGDQRESVLRFKPVQNGVNVKCVAPEMVLLGSVALNLDRWAFPHFAKMTERYGFSSTMKILQEVRKVFSKANEDFNILFSHADLNLDVLTLAKAFLSVSKMSSFEEALSLLRRDRQRLMCAHDRRELKKRFQKRWHLEIEPSNSFVRQWRSSKFPLKRKLTRLETILPRWCLVHLMQSDKLAWMTNDFRRTERIITTLTEALEPCMASSIVKEAVFVILSRSPAIFESHPMDLKEKCALLSN